MNMTNETQKPGLVTAIALMTLTSGIVNLFWGFIASATALGTIVGVICLPITILPTILGIFEIIYAAKLLSAQPQPVQSSTSLAVFQILTFMMGNIFSMIVGILNLVFYNDLAVKEYFARINGATVQTPGAVTPPMPLIVEPEPAPLTEPVTNLLPPEEPAQPVKPKRTKKPASK